MSYETMHSLNKFEDRIRAQTIKNEDEYGMIKARQDIASLVVEMSSKIINLDLDNELIKWV